MGELDDFLAATMGRQIAAETAMHHRDPEPRLAMWSTQDPVTLFGGGVARRTGRDEIARTFRWAATGIIPCRSFDYEVLVAGVSGDLAYTVGYEHTVLPSLEDYTLCVTFLYRREHGAWRIVHRHASYLTTEPNR
jgi:ketosteroid isomerase-like protein